MTPNEILNKRFNRAAVGGYRTEEVHEFLASVSDYIEKINADRLDLERKMQFLAEKIEEYREDEESLRAALIDAQKSKEAVVQAAKEEAAAIVGKAQVQADTLVKSAKTKADGLLSSAKLQVDTEAYALNRMQMEVSKFRAQILHMYEKQMELINVIPFDDSKLKEPLPKPEGLTSKAGKKEQEFKKLLEEVVEESKEEKAKLDFETAFDKAETEKDTEIEIAAKTAKTAKSVRIEEEVSEAANTKPSQDSQDSSSAERPPRRSQLRGYQEGFRLDE